MSVYEGQEFEDFTAFKRAMLACANDPNSQIGPPSQYSGVTALSGSLQKNEGRDCAIVASLIVHVLPTVSLRGRAGYSISCRPPGKQPLVRLSMRLPTVVTSQSTIDPLKRQRI